jgi:hypothetical protein
MSRFIRAIAVLSLLVASMTYARDAYVIGMDARGANVTSCSWLIWRGDIVFYNTSATELRVRVVGVSNGTLRVSGHEEIAVPARSAVSRDMATGGFWYPLDSQGLAPLWIWRLEVPDAVRVHSEMRLDEVFCTPSVEPETRGEITLPTFDELVPANEQQVFLGTDVGELPRRVNVGLYNSGPVTSNAELRLHRACDNAVLVATAVAVPANTTLQTQLQSGAAPPPCAEPGTANGTYVTVMLDQPGLAFVSVLSNDDVTRLTHNFVRR